MFQFPPFASLLKVRIITLQVIGLSHSEIPGSRVICTYPGLIAAYHVLHRLREPRHPPCALSFFLLPAAMYHAPECIRTGPLILSAVLVVVLSTYSLACVNMSKIGAGQVPADRKSAR